MQTFRALLILGMKEVLYARNSVSIHLALQQRHISEHGFSSDAIASLMSTQWLRTIPATSAALILAWMMIMSH